MTADVSAVADGLAIYFTQSVQDTFPTGWLIASGTSFATPFVAGALTSLGIANGQFSPAWVWQNPNNFYDVTTGNNINTSSSGSNAAACSASPAYFCTAGVGYDGPTGWGTPNGILLATALPPGSDAGAGAPDGGNDEAGSDDAGTDEGGSVGDTGDASVGGGGSGTTDATTMVPPPPFDGGQTLESGSGPNGADPGGTIGSWSSTGCGCVTASGQPSPPFAALSAGLLLTWGCRRRLHRRAGKFRSP
jgi:hypothetical protein